MSHTRIALDPNLRKLRDEGFDLEVRANHLLVHAVPYVTPARCVAYGTLAMALNMVGDELGPPPDHQAKFMVSVRPQPGASHWSSLPEVATKTSGPAS